MTEVTEAEFLRSIAEEYLRNGFKKSIESIKSAQPKAILNFFISEMPFIKVSLYGEVYIVGSERKSVWTKKLDEGSPTTSDLFMFNNKATLPAGMVKEWCSIASTKKETTMPIPQKELKKIGKEVYDAAIAGKNYAIVKNSMFMAKAVNEFRLSLEKIAFDNIIESAKQKLIYDDNRAFRLFLELLTDPKENIRSLQGTPFKSLPFEVESVWGDILASQAQKILKGLAEVK